MTDDAQSLAEQCGTSVHATNALLCNLQEQKIKYALLEPPGSKLEHELASESCSLEHELASESGSTRRRNRRPARAMKRCSLHEIRTRS